MRKAWLASAFVFCLGLVAATSYALLTPVSARAATGEANCPYGQKVTCEAYKCACVDGAGCIAEDRQGKQTYKPCPSRPGPIAEIAPEVGNEQ